MGMLKTLSAFVLGSSAAALPNDETSLLQAHIAEGGSHPKKPYGPFKFPSELKNVGNAQYLMPMRLGDDQWLQSVIDTTHSDVYLYSDKCPTCGPERYHTGSSGRAVGNLETVERYTDGSAEVFSSGMEYVGWGPYETTKMNVYEISETKKLPMVSNYGFGALLGVAPGMTPHFDRVKKVNAKARDLTTLSKEEREVPRPKAAVLPTEAPAPVMKTKKVKAPPKGWHQTTSWQKEMIEKDAKSKELPPWNPPVPTSPMTYWNLRSFSICLGKKQDDNGTVIWNDTITSEMPSRFMDVTLFGPDDGWDLRVQDMKFTYRGAHTGKELQNVYCTGEEGCRAKLDSATSLLGAPAQVVQHIKEVFDSEVAYDCSNVNEVMPWLTFKFGNRKASLPPSSYIGQLQGQIPKNLEELMPNLKTLTKECDLLLMDSSVMYGEGTGTWVLGVPWFREFYTTFRLGDDLEPPSVKIAVHTAQNLAPIDWGTLQTLPEQKVPLLKIQASSIRIPARLDTQQIFKRGTRPKTL